MFKINRKKWRDLSFLGVLTVYMFASHQNCAPSPNLSEKAEADGSQIVGTIDDVRKDAAVSFAMKELQLSNQVREINLEGKCSVNQEGAILGWEVRKQAEAPDEGALFATGYARCEGGRFIVELAPTQLLDCNKAYLVKAQLGHGEAGVSVVTRACPL